MISDFANNILTEFGNLVSIHSFIQSFTYSFDHLLIGSFIYLFGSFLKFHQASTIEKKQIIYSPKVSTAAPSSAQTTAPSNSNGVNGKYTSPAPSFSAPELNSSIFPLTPPSQAMTTAGMGGTTAGVNPKDPFHMRSFSSSTIVNIANQAVNVPTDMKLKKRASGRIQKLIADLYLMAGRLPDAVSQCVI